jgi:hypothetical protein
METVDIENRMVGPFANIEDATDGAILVPQKEGQTRLDRLASGTKE